MKKTRILFALMAMAMMTFSFALTSCGGDDDNNGGGNKPGESTYTPATSGTFEYVYIFGKEALNYMDVNIKFTDASGNVKTIDLDPTTSLDLSSISEKARTTLNEELVKKGISIDDICIFRASVDCPSLPSKVKTDFSMAVKDGVTLPEKFDIYQGDIMTFTGNNNLIRQLVSIQKAGGVKSARINDFIRIYTDLYSRTYTLFNDTNNKVVDIAYVKNSTENTAE